jgi:hypothetical protein
MHSFHQSRSRIAFEVLCALTVSASCALAWIQIGATAFLPAALATGLYGLWHLTDMRSPRAATSSSTVVEEQPDRIAFSDPEPTVDEAPAPAKPKKRNRKKASPVVESPAEPVVEAAPEPEAAFPDRAEIEEELHAPIAPLFEAKPFALQQRPTFGRKAG